MEFRRSAWVVAFTHMGIDGCPPGYLSLAASLLKWLASSQQSEGFRGRRAWHAYAWRYLFRNLFSKATKAALGLMNEDTSLSGMEEEGGGEVPRKLEAI